MRPSGRRSPRRRPVLSRSTMREAEIDPPLGRPLAGAADDIQDDFGRRVRAIS